MARCRNPYLACVLVASCFAMLATAALAAQGSQSAAQPQPKVSSTPTPSLADVDLQGDFDPRHDRYTYLRPLGRTVDEARQKADAESLAMCAALLFQAERSSGRTSPHLTAAALLDEATRLAEAQGNPAALQACASVWGSAPFGPNDATRSAALAQRAQACQAERNARRAPARLLVRNKTRYAVNVYVDDEFVGSLSGYESGRMRVYNGAARLYATSQYHEFSWGPRQVDLAGEYTWTLTD